MKATMSVVERPYFIKERDWDIFCKRNQGSKFTVLAREYDISPPYVREIYYRCRRLADESRPLSGMLDNALKRSGIEDISQIKKVDIRTKRL